MAYTEAPTLLAIVILFGYGPFAYSFYYGLLSIGHMCIQIIFGEANAIRERRWSRTHAIDLVAPDVWPPVALIVPVYNEDPDVLRDCLRSVAAVQYPDFLAYAVDDGSPNQAELERVYAEFPTLTTILLERNVGKRRAQHAVFGDLPDNGIYVTVDSDTIIRSPEDVSNLILPMIHNPKLGAVTGEVRVENRDVNLLTRLISMRYWIAFHQERGAQSLFGVVGCCSGPFAAYRADLVHLVKDRYITETFRGVECTFGDDRHLTNLILAEGADVTFHSRGVAYTHVPTKMRGYLKQQLRWSKSFYRELLWSLRFVKRRHLYFYVDQLLQGVLPFLLLVALGLMIDRAVVTDWTVAARYGLILLLIGTLRAMYGLLSTRNWRFTYFAMYGVLHIVLMVPTRMYAMATINRTHWGTRGGGT